MSLNTLKADIVICGAGIAGVAAAHFLCTKLRAGTVLLVDDRAPLTLTSDKSSEGYRNWWPGPDDAMIRLMDRSIDLMETLASENDNRFHLNRRGYVYLTADQQRLPFFQKEAMDIARLGAGPLRVGQTYEPSPAQGYEPEQRGADLLLDSNRIHAHFPFLNHDIVAMLHPRRCGWLSAQQLGMLLLEKALAGGARLVQGQVLKITLERNQVASVTVGSNQKEIQISTRVFINAAGPFARQVAGLLNVDLPVTNELHGKIAFEDSLGVIPRDAPLMIWNDPLTLPWSEEEQQELAASEDTAWMLDPLPPGLHFRPEGGSGSKTVLCLWPYHIHQTQQPAWPLRFDPEFVEVVLRGMVRMIPGMAVYLDRMSPPYVDGGYYTKTQENRPLIGPLPVEGAYVFGALSGFGIMAAMAGAELLGAHIGGADLPAYAPSFTLSRYDDPHYLALVKEWDLTTGQL